MKIIFAWVFLPVGLSCLAQAQELPQGAAATGMGTTMVALPGTYSLFQNVAGLGNLKHTAAMSSYHRRYGTEGLAAMHVGAVLPLKVGVAGLGVSRLGDELLSIHTLSGGYAHRIEQFSVGVRANWQQYSAEGFGSRSIALVDMGGMASISSQITVGLLISNLNRATISRYTGHKATSRIQAGFAYQPLTELTLALEAEQQVGTQPKLKAGAAYLWEQKVAFRTGIQSTDRQHYFGLGLYHRILKLDYALSTHAYLGSSHAVSLAYHFRQ